MKQLISKEEIRAKIEELGNRINADYADKKLTILMVMKGSICFAADLIRTIQIPFTLEYITASSYGEHGMNRSSLLLRGLEHIHIEGRDLLLVDDIFETGNTILELIEQLQEKKPRSIKTALLLVKDVPRKSTYLPDYTLFHIPNLFVIGYGLDYKELYRGLPNISAFIDNRAPF